jgi:hypothetical protein
MEGLPDGQEASEPSTWSAWRLLPTTHPATACRADGDKRRRACGEATKKRWAWVDYLRGASLKLHFFALELQLRLGGEAPRRFALLTPLHLEVGVRQGP